MKWFPVSADTRKCLIALFNVTIHEECAVKPSALFVDGKEHYAGRFTVYAVKRRQVFDSGAPSQTVKQTFINIASARSHGKEMGFACDQNLVVEKQDFFNKRNKRLTADFAEIKKAVQGEYSVSSVIRRDFSLRTFLGNAFLPDLRGNGGESSAQESEDGRVRFFCFRHGNNGRVFRNSHVMYPQTLSCCSWKYEVTNFNARTHQK